MESFIARARTFLMHCLNFSLHWCDHFWTKCRIVLHSMKQLWSHHYCIRGWPFKSRNSQCSVRNLCKTFRYQRPQGSEPSRIWTTLWDPSHQTMVTIEKWFFLANQLFWFVTNQESLQNEMCSCLQLCGNQWSGQLTEESLSLGRLNS